MSGEVGHVEHAEAELTDAGIATMEVTACPYALDELVGKRLACLEVEGEGVQEVRLYGKVLHDLRGQFHEVATDIRAAQGPIVNL